MQQHISGSSSCIVIQASMCDMEQLTINHASVAHSKWSNKTTQCSSSSTVINLKTPLRQLQPSTLQQGFGGEVVFRCEQPVLFQCRMHAMCLASGNRPLRSAELNWYRRATLLLELQCTTVHLGLLIKHNISITRYVIEITQRFCCCRLSCKKKKAHADLNPGATDEPD